MVDLLREIGTPLLLGAIGGALAHFWWVRQYVREIQRDYDAEIRHERMLAYRKLWQRFVPLAVYAPGENISYADITKLGVSLREWYFADGGLLLTARARSVYFLIQNAIDQVRRMDARGVMRAEGRLWTREGLEDERPQLGIPALPASGRGDTQSAKWADEVGKLVADWSFGSRPDDDFVLLQFLASSLRTVLVEDLHARAPSILTSR